MSKYFALILVTVALNSSSQLLMKAGMSRVDQFEFSGAQMGRMLLNTFTEPLILLGLTTMVISMVTYLMALSRFDVSFTFPFLSLGFVVVALYGYFILGENVNPVRVAGILVIVAGAVLVSQS